MTLESLPFALMIMAGFVATFLFAAWALYAQTHGSGSGAGWTVDPVENRRRRV